MREFADLSSPSLSISRGSRSKEEFARITAAIDAAINKSPPDWTSVTVERGVVYIPDQPTSKEDLRKPRDPVKAEGTFDVQIARAPFSRGGVRVAHYARVKVGGTWKEYVAKQFMEPHNQTRAQVLGTLEGNSVTRFLAAEWMAAPAGKCGHRQGRGVHRGAGAAGRPRRP